MDEFESGMLYIQNGIGTPEPDIADAMTHCACVNIQSDNGKTDSTTSIIDSTTSIIDSINDNRSQ